MSVIQLLPLQELGSPQHSRGGNAPEVWPDRLSGVIRGHQDNDESRNSRQCFRTGGVQCKKARPIRTAALQHSATLVAIMAVAQATQFRISPSLDCESTHL